MVCGICKEEGHNSRTCKKGEKKHVLNKKAIKPDFEADEKEGNSATRACSNCKQTGHNISTCTAKGGKAYKAAKHCSLCQKEGHNKGTCRQKEETSESAAAAESEEEEEELENAGYHTPDEVEHKTTKGFKQKTTDKKKEPEKVKVKAAQTMTVLDGGPKMTLDDIGGRRHVDCGGRRCAGVDGSSNHITKHPRNCLRALPGEPEAKSSWIGYWKMMTGREGKRHLRCAVAGCDENITIFGNHVWLEGEDPHTAPCCWIMAGCQAHNGKTFDLREKDTAWMKLKPGTMLVPAPVAAGMRHYAEGGGGGRPRRGVG